MELFCHTLCTEVKASSKWGNTLHFVNGWSVKEIMTWFKTTIVKLTLENYLSSVSFIFYPPEYLFQMAPHSSTLAWRIPGTAEPGGLLSTGLHTVGRDWSDLAAELIYSWNFGNTNLWKCCTQYASKFGKLSSGGRTGKGQFSFQSQRKAMPENAQTTTQLHSSHTLVK